jgi:cysteinyl-tRNA synthetase
LREDFKKSLFNDINISPALAALFRFVRQVNHLISKGRLHREDTKLVMDALHLVDNVLSLLPTERVPAELPAAVKELVQKREQARKEKDFALADEIRRQLDSKGFSVKDLPGGKQELYRN